LKMTRADWHRSGPVLGMFLNGEEIASPGPRGERVTDDAFLVLFNAGHEDVSFKVPNRRFGKTWTVVVDTAQPEVRPVECTVGARGELPVTSRSAVLLQRSS